MMKLKGKKDIHSAEKKKKRNRGKNADVETHVTMNIEVDHRMQVGKTKKEKASTNRKRKKKDKNLVGRQIPKGKVDLEEQSDGVVDNCHSKAEGSEDSKEHRDADIGAAIKPCRSKKAKKKNKK